MVPLEFVRVIAVEAGAIAHAALRGDLQVSEKLNASDLLTQVDVEVENHLKDRIKKQFPSHQFICEESDHSHRLGSQPTWIIDPIDGTMNFVYGMPTFCVSVAFADGGQIQHGVVHAPMMGETFAASRGEGATLNGQAIRVSTACDLERACVATGFCAGLLKLQGLSAEHTKLISELDEIVKHNAYTLIRRCRDVRRLGASALELAWVACGRLDAALEMGNKEWDIAAGSLLVSEAGGVVTYIDGAPLGDLGDRSFMAANSESLHQALRNEIRCPSQNVRCFD
ncbi:MAG: hypothetical protein KVP17_004865 [Porospora cf. gigantea B]|uniref:uncharacterized protein n=1 Tax=Porospora cf. gigantea B TaxID=2853592 RepID=UPI003571AE6C|nr:MAG: hypothetical protein KVP17_004865 [Porospora cf. gigantea B]